MQGANAKGNNLKKAAHDRSGTRNSRTESGAAKCVSAERTGEEAKAA